MDKNFVEVSRYFNSILSCNIFLCLVSDNEILYPLKVKIKRNSAFLVQVNPSNCRANFFIKCKDGVRYYHHVDIDFIPRKSWNEFNLKQFIEKMGFEYRDIVLGPCYPNNSNLPYSNNWERYPTDSEYGICVIETTPPRLKHIYLVRGALILCEKSVAKIEYGGRTSLYNNLPKDLVLSSHIWTVKDVDTIIKRIPNYGLRDFKVYLYDCNVEYSLHIDETKAIISANDNIGNKCSYSNLKPINDKDSILKWGFEKLFSFVSTGSIDAIKRKMQKLEMIGVVKAQQ